MCVDILQLSSYGNLRGRSLIDAYEDHQMVILHVWQQLPFSIELQTMEHKRMTFTSPAWVQHESHFPPKK